MVWDVTIKGNDAIIAKIGKLASFEATFRPLMDQAMADAEGEIRKRLPGSTPAKALTTEVKMLGSSIIVGKAGPRAGKNRTGFKAANALESGTGLFHEHAGAKHPITPLGLKPQTRRDSARHRKGLAGPGGPGKLGHAKALSFTPRSGGRVARASAKGMHPQPWHDASQTAGERDALDRLATGTRRVIGG